MKTENEIEQVIALHELLLRRTGNPEEGIAVRVVIDALRWVVDKPSILGATLPIAMEVLESVSSGELETAIEAMRPMVNLEFEL